MLNCSYRNIVNFIILSRHRRGHNILVMGRHLVLQNTDKNTFTSGQCMLCAAYFKDLFFLPDTVQTDMKEAAWNLT